MRRGKMLSNCVLRPRRSPCVDVEGNRNRHGTDKQLRQRLRQELQRSGSSISGIEFERLLAELNRSIRFRAMAARRWSADRLAEQDIVLHIIRARDGGDFDEAYWLSFLAAHFGRESADKNVQGQVESAGRLACAFGTRPFWTWRRVSKSPDDLRRWLMEHAADLRSLSFGNHRKFESKKPRALWEVIESFLALVERYTGSPAAMFKSDDALSPTQRHAVLYERLRPLRRFGRTARFDWLSLLNDLRRLQVAPASCHLRGATGPLAGARRLWPSVKTPRELEERADQLAAKLGISPLVIEDCLCNWQKD